MRKTNQVHLKNGDNSLDSGQSGSLKAELDSNYLSGKVRFTFRDCSLNGENGACKTLRHRDVASDLFKTLRRFEEMDWTTFINLPRESGWSQEKVNQPNYLMLKNDFPNYTQFGHIRINSKDHSAFRIFCGRIEDMVAILKIDVDGKINH